MTALALGLPAQQRYTIRVKQPFLALYLLLGALLLPAQLGCGAPLAPANDVPQTAQVKAQPAQPTPLANPPLESPWRREARLREHQANTRLVTGPSFLLRGGRLLLGDGRELPRGDILVRAGRIVAVGPSPIAAPAATPVINLAGKTVTPGLIDTHSHMGVYPAPRAAAHADGNEMTKPVTPGVRAIDAFWPNDPQIERAVAGGTTTIMALPGSGNLIGGRGTVLKLRRAVRSRSMHFRGARDGLKMACGENPKRVYGNRKRMPMTRMGNLMMQRSAFLRAKRLMASWDSWRKGEQRRLRKLAKKKNTSVPRAAASHAKDQTAPPNQTKPSSPSKGSSKRALPPARDLHLETLAAAMAGEVLVHIHCYRSDDMANMIALADEMGFRIRSFHHALEAYKIRDELARRRIAVSTWADWWGFKMEAYDGIQQNLALNAAAGGIAVVHSDSAEGIRRLNQEAAKGLWSGIHAGIQLDEAEAIRWITGNAAWALGIDDWVGTLAKGKDADIVVWDRNPFSVYARAERVFVDGNEVHRLGQKKRPWSDFEAAPNEISSPPSPNAGAAQ